MGRTTTERILFVPDTHAPFHDRKSWALLLAVAKQLKPQHVVVLGDFIDCYSISQHDKDPGRVNALEDELHSAKGLLLDLERVTPSAKLYFVEGNHEHRLQRYVWKRAPELHGMLDMKKLLIPSNRWKYTKYGDSCQIGKLYVTHDEGNAGDQAHVRARSTFEGNVVIGHTHRMAVSYRGNAKGKAHVGAMFGWLGDHSAIDYMHRVRCQQWVHGCGVGYLLPGGNVHIQAVPFIDGVAVVNGHAVRARQR